MKAQQIWRSAGLVFILGSAGMAWYGANIPWREYSLNFFVIYWGGFMVLFVAAIYCALLDIRYITAQYAAAKREVFRETLGDEDFRRALREAHKKKQSNSD